MRIFVSIFFILLLLSLNCFAVPIDEHGPTEDTAIENVPDFTEMFEIKVVNAVNGDISVSTDGKKWDKIGSVLRPANQVNNNGYTASKWAGDSEVAATAVNAIHMRTCLNEKLDRGTVFSLIPVEFMEPIANYKSFYSPSSSIYTDIKAGEGIFGGDYAPFVGNKIGLITDEALVSLSKDYVPKINDILVITVDRPTNYPKEIEFENRFGGFIKIRYPDGKGKIIGEVLKPVEGVGRFTGGQFTWNGRIRANHTGVIDVCTATNGDIAGFQIIPADHGMSPEMTNARVLTQWMVVGPANVNDSSPEGTAPLFKYFIRPVYSGDDISKEDWKDRLAHRFLVEAKIKDGDWEPLPIFNLSPYIKGPIVPWANTALKDVTDIRILFPVYE